MAFKQSFKIGDRNVGGGAPCLIVGEIGPNHDGDPGKAKALIDICANAGCDGVKFQYHLADAEIFDRATKSYYYDETRYDFIKREQEMPRDTHRMLRDHARARGLVYLCSVFSEEAVDEVALLDPEAFKVPSGEVSNGWLLERLVAHKKPIVASSGMSDIAEIDGMMDVLKTVSDEVVLLHCLSEYPTPRSEMHLKLIPVLSQRYGCPVGLSDHSRNIAEVAASVALGGAMIEVHVTIDRNLRGPDPQISVLPDELGALVGRVRELEEALGHPEKILGKHAQAMRGSFTNSIVTRCFVSAGEVFSRANLTLMKPSSGLPPSELPRILGRRATADIPPRTALKRGDFT